MELVITMTDESLFVVVVLGGRGQSFHTLRAAQQKDSALAILAFKLWIATAYMQVALTLTPPVCYKFQVYSKIKMLLG